MLDIALIRKDPEAVRAALARKGEKPEALDGVLQDDGLRRSLIAEVETLRARRNEISKAIGKARQRGEDTRETQLEVRAVGDRIASLEGGLQEIEDRQNDRLLRIPNLPHGSVPDGEDEGSNRVVSEWGERPSFAFEPKAHDDLGTALGILDFERAARMSGARFVLYRGDGAALERALVTFMLDLHVREHGYTEILPPYLVRAEALLGTGNLPKFEADLFRVDGGDLYLIPTAEVPVTNLHREEILAEGDLPLSYCAFTPCFRSEAGSHGKDTKGMIRLHQFHKVELVTFSRPEDSYARLDRLTGDAERVLQLLGLHYRKVVLCAGDMSFASAKTFDLEVWLPSQDRYREISSCTNFEEFQARRAGIRYRPEGGGKPRFVHTLNGSALAVGRTVVAVLEQFQREDGTVRIPEALRPYLNGKKVLGG